MHPAGRPSQGRPPVAARRPGREAAQIARLRRLAENAKLDPAFAEKLLNFIIAEVIRHHERIADDAGVTTDPTDSSGE